MAIYDQDGYDLNKTLSKGQQEFKNTLKTTGKVDVGGPSASSGSNQMHYGTVLS
jgi:hypothetical protein